MAQCYRTRTGLFKPPVEEVTDHPAQGGVELKTLFRMLSGGGGGGGANGSSTRAAAAYREADQTLFPPAVGSSSSSRGATRRGGGETSGEAREYIPLSQTTSRSQSDASMITDLVSTSPSQGPSRVETIVEELDELQTF